MTFFDMLIEGPRSLLDTTGFPPRWLCGSGWTSLLGWTHIIADIVIFASYLAIPLTMLIFIKKIYIKDYKEILILYIAFILLCGIGHLIEAIIFWHPLYRLSGLIKLTTAIVSFFTALSVIKHLPKLLQISSLLEQKDYLEYVLLNTPYPLLLINKDFKILTCNYEMYKLIGYEEGGLINHSFINVITERFRDQFIKDIKYVTKSCKHYNEKMEIYDYKNNILKVDVSLVFLEHKGKGEVLIAIKDMAKSYELDLTTKKLEAIFNSTVDGMITITDKGDIRMFNPAAEKIFGYQAKEVQGKNVKMLMTDYYSKDHDSYLSNYINTGIKKIIGTHRVVQGLTKQGKIVPLELSISSINIENQYVFTGILRDISERLEMEEKIKLAYSELESFSYIAAHDLREPLRGINNYVTFILEDCHDSLDEGGKEKLYILQKLSKRLEGFIESLLHYSRLEREDNRNSIVDLNYIINDLLLSLKITFEMQNVEVILEPNLPSIRGDIILITELYQNLIINAYKYNNKEKKVIKLGYLKDPKKGNVLFVQDNGIGIKEEHQDIIFRMFKRLHARDSFGGGSGVGLTIVKKVIQKHGGDIWVESNIDIGTTFYFTLEGQYGAN